ncbi:MAG: hypothetical protein IKE62_01335 [Oscillospiraceae bacterium]|nr:hypothetical protein [Oscillospiraceae bacterium]
MKRFNDRLPGLVPPGFPWRRELGIFGAMAAMVTLYSMRFLISWSYERQLLFRNGELLEGAVMKDFAPLIHPVVISYLLFAAVFFAVYSALGYAYHWRGAKPVYLMRRMPDRFYWHRKCLVMPAALALCAIVWGLVIVHIYYLIYICFTPEQCVAPGQWAAVWRF